MISFLLTFFFILSPWHRRYTYLCLPPVRYPSNIVFVVWFQERLEIILGFLSSEFFRILIILLCSRIHGICHNQLLNIFGIWPEFQNICPSHFSYIFLCVVSIFHFSMYDFKNNIIIMCLIELVTVFWVMIVAILQGISPVLDVVIDFGNPGLLRQTVWGTQRLYYLLVQLFCFSIFFV